MEYSSHLISLTIRNIFGVLWIFSPSCYNFTTAEAQRLSRATPISLETLLLIPLTTMLRNVCVFLFLGVTGVVLSASINVNLLPCPTVRPTITSVEQVLGDWYAQELTVSDRIPQVQLCNNVEIRDVRVSDSGVKSFSFLLFNIRNGTEKRYVFNKTLDVSTECPGHWITKEKDGYVTVAAETEDRKLICLAMTDGWLATFILSRDEEPQTSQLQDIKDNMKAAGVVVQSHVITRNGTLC